MDRVIWQMVDGESHDAIKHERAARPQGLDVSHGLACQLAERADARPASAQPNAAAARRLRLEHGDVVVWGGPARLFFHGVDVLAEGEHPATGRARINLTFRKAL